MESGKAESPEMDDFLKKLLSPYVGKLNALVLGCTHYPFAAQAISRLLGPGTVLLDGGEGTARETKRRLAAAGLLRRGEGSITITNSADDPAITALAWKLLEGKP